MFGLPNPRSSTRSSNLPIVEKLGTLGEGRKRKRLEEYVKLTNSFEPEIEELTAGDLAHKTVELRERLDRGEDLEDLLPEAFACVREAARRTIGQRHFDVQLMGGVVLHQGDIAEMRTGEGKTLAATLPTYLNGLTGKGCPRRHHQRLPGQARLGMDGPHPPRPRSDHRPHPGEHVAGAASPELRRGRQRTARTTSSASTTSATTWRCAPRTWSSTGITSASSTRWTPS